jgi:hypothetical protein
MDPRPGNRPTFMSRVPMVQLPPANGYPSWSFHGDLTSGCVPTIVCLARRSRRAASCDIMDYRLSRSQISGFPARLRARVAWARREWRVTTATPGVPHIMATAGRL